MPWLSRSSSPVQSPRCSTLHSSSPVTYIPPLIDGACGTILREQQPFLATLGADARTLFRLLPDFALSAWEDTAGQWRSLSWRDAGDVLLQIVVSMVEVYIIILALPLWLVLPGAFFLLWLPTAVVIIWGLCWLLNSREPVVRHAGPSSYEGSWMIGPMAQEGEDERWFFVGGMSMSSRTVTTSTLPQLAKLFNRPITAILEPIYGLPLDLLLLLGSRALPMLPDHTTRLLYGQLRAALQDGSVNRAVVLAHNRGALPVSRVLSRLCSDLPHGKISKLEVYTFGAAADEFVVPLGDGRLLAEMSPHGGSNGATTNGNSGSGGGSTMANGTGSTAAAAAAASNGSASTTSFSPSVAELITRRAGPHIEHFAHARDPFARLGVLRSVRQDLGGRFCGGVFVINSAGDSMSMSLGMGMMGGVPGGLGTRYGGPYGYGSTSNGHGYGGGSRHSAQQQQQPHSASGGPRSPLFPPGAYTTSGNPAGEKQQQQTLVARLSTLGGLLPAAPPVVGLEDYLTALFPEQVPALANCGRASILDSIMTIDRDVAEKREFAAMASHASSTRSSSQAGSAPNGSNGNSNSNGTSKAAVRRGDSGAGSANVGLPDAPGAKRLSWTGLGATAGGGGNMDGGLLGLKIARMGCKRCDGHRGREVSRLVRYVTSGLGLGVIGGGPSSEYGVRADGEAGVGSDGLGVIGGRA